MKPHKTRVLPFLCAGITASALLACYVCGGRPFLYALLCALLLSLIAFTVLRKRSFFALSVTLLGAAACAAVFCARADALERYARSLDPRVPKTFIVAEAGEGSVVITEGFSSPKIRLYTDENLAVGDKIEASVDLIGQNGDFFTLASAARGIPFTGYFVSLSPKPDSSGLPLWLFPSKIRQQSLAAFDKLFTDSWFFKPLVLGGYTGMPEDFRALASDVGITHIFSVSGMHVSFLTGAVVVLLGRRRRRAALFAVFPVILFFMAVCGFVPSAVRAGIMQMAALSALFIRRESTGLSGVYLSLALMLLLNPFAVGDIGLQLSFAAVAGIVTVGESMKNALFSRIWRKSPDASPAPRASSSGASDFARTPDSCGDGSSPAPANPVPAPPASKPSLFARLSRALARKVLRAAIACLSVTVSAQIFTLPLLILYFGRVSVVAVLTNFVTVFAVEIAFFAALVSITTSFISLSPASLFAAFAYLCKQYIVWVMKLVAQIPYLTVGLATTPAAVWLAFSYVIGYLMYKTYKKYKTTPKYTLIKTVSLILSLAVISSGLDAYSRKNTFTVYTPSTASHSVVLIKDNAAAVLGCGSTATGDLSDFLKSRNFRKIGVLLLNRPEELPGALSLLQTFEVRLLLAPYSSDEGYKQALAEAAAKNGAQLKLCTHDERYDIGEISLLVMVTPCGLPAVLAQGGGVRLLATGSIDEESTKYMLSTREGLSCTLLVTRALLFDRVFSKESGDLSHEYVIITGRRASESADLGATVFHTLSGDVRLSFRSGRVYAR